MEIIILTDPGCERACETELQRIISKKGRVGTGTVHCDLTLQEACTFTFRTQTALRVLVYLGALSAVPSRLEFFGETYRISGKEELISQIATWLTPHITSRVDLENPDTVVYAHSETVIGIDLGGELWKRDWRVMLSNRSLRATIAASAAIYANVTPKSRVVDPFGDDGTLTIETAFLQTGKSPRSFVKSFPFQRLPPCTDINVEDHIEEASPVTAFVQDLRDVKAVRMNSKLAGCHVTVTKLPIEWLHTKIEDVALVLTYPPSSGKHISPKRATALLREFFVQMHEVLSPGGTITCVTLKPDELIRAADGFVQTAALKVHMGKMPLAFVTFTSQR